MAFSNYGQLKAEINEKLFHQRFLSNYDSFTTTFERAANRRCLGVRQMEAVANLTTTNGEVALPSDYLLWRTIKPSVAVTRWQWDELEYVHPAYLPPTTASLGTIPRLFTIEGSLFKTRPIDDVNAYEFHYYRQIPSLVGNNANTNWLLLEYPDAYLFGMMTEASAHGRNVEGAQLYKSRRDEVLAEIIRLSALTTGPAAAPQQRTAEYF
jgi:hypothetical protein